MRAFVVPGAPVGNAQRLDYASRPSLHPARSAWDRVKVGIHRAERVAVGDDGAGSRGARLEHGAAEALAPGGRIARVREHFSLSHLAFDRLAADGISERYAHAAALLESAKTLLDVVRSLSQRLDRGEVRRLVESAEPWAEAVEDVKRGVRDCSADLWPRG